MKAKQVEQQGQEELLKSFRKIIPLLKRYLPINEYAAYEEFLKTCDLLAARVDKQKQGYQDKAEYHREISRKWREDNKEVNATYMKRYYGKACHCEEKDKCNWHIIGIARKNKLSSSQTYLVKCDICLAEWRTKAAYCQDILDRSPSAGGV